MYKVTLEELKSYKQSLIDSTNILVAFEDEVKGPLNVEINKSIKKNLEKIAEITTKFHIK